MNNTFSWKTILINALIVYGLTLLGGFIVGMLFGKAMLHDGTTLVAIGLTNCLMAILGFFIAGMRTSEPYWPQMFMVAVLIWLSGLINIFLMNSTLVKWIGSSLVVLILFGIGGGLALLVKPKQAQQPDQTSRAKV